MEGSEAKLLTGVSRIAIVCDVDARTPTLPPQQIQIATRVDVATYAELVVFAAREERSLSYVLRTALERALAQAKEAA